MPNTVFVGLALTAHNNEAVATATFDNVTVTGNTGALPPPTLQLTNGLGGQTGAAFTTSRVGVANFTTTFKFQFHGGSNPSGEGMAFVLQAVNPTAYNPTGLGGAGGGLGYGGIPNSIAIKFDLNSNLGEGNNSTGLFLNGDLPTIAANPGETLHDLTPDNIDLHSQHVFQVTLSYDGTTLMETITDQTTTVSVTIPYTVDIGALLGGSVGYAGFTASTSSLTTITDIFTWTYQFTEPTGPAPRPGAGGGGSGAVGLSGVTGTLNPGTVTLPGAPGQASVAGVPAASGQASSNGNHGPRLADILFSDRGSGSDAWQGLSQALAGHSQSGLGSDLLGQAGLDTNDLDLFFSQM
jgi:hypothetical protein